MLRDLIQLLPPEAVKMGLVLFLSFLVGLEREEHKAQGVSYAFGGVRTFPLIGLMGYATALLAGDRPPVLVAVGFALVGGFMLLSYRHKLATSEGAGITSELSALGTFLVGALVYHGLFWISCALVILSVLLLELKTLLEGLSTRIGYDQIFAFTKFLLLAVVILPIVPNQEFTPLHINPFKTWLVVVAVSGVSYGSYLLQRKFKGRGGVLLSAILGGVYSSTSTTVVLARQSTHEQRPCLFSGSILAACGVMYLRLTILVAILNLELAARLAGPFIGLGLLAVGTGARWSKRDESGTSATEAPSSNPLELRVALSFAAIFVAVVCLTELVLARAGQGGVFSLATLMGLTDVDPFVLGLAQTSGASVAPHIAAGGIVIASASNNVMKGIYALTIADRKTGREALAWLLGLAALGLVPLLWV